MLTWNHGLSLDTNLSEVCFCN